MLSYRTRNNQDMYYVVNSTIGDLNQVYGFLAANNLILSSVPVGVIVNYDVSIKPPPSVKSSPKKPVITSQNYFSRENQNIYDVALMTLTDLNQIMNLVLNSNFDNVNTSPRANSKFTYNPLLITDNILSKFTSQSNIIFNTGQRIEADGPITPELKEFMDGVPFAFQDGILYRY